MPNILKKKIFWIPLGAVLIIGIIFAFSKKTKVPEFSSTSVVKKNLIQSVEETGQISAAQELSYGFETNGRITSVTSKIGSSVVTGDVLATIDSTTQVQALRQAQSSLAGAQATLSLQLAGPSNEARAESFAAVQKTQASLAQSQADFERSKIQAQIDIDTAQKDLEKAENDLRIFAQTGASQLVRNAYVDLLNAIKSALPTLSKGLTEADNILGIDNALANDDFQETLGALNQETLYKAKQAYPLAKSSKKTAESIVTPLTTMSSESGINTATDHIQKALTDTRELLLNTRALLEATPPIEITQSQLDAHKTDITNALTSVNTDITTVANAEQEISEAKTSESGYQIAYERAKLDLETTKQRSQTTIAIAKSAVDIAAASVKQAEAAHAKLIAPPRDVDIASLRADVSRYAAAVASTQKEIDKTNLVAITDGTIAKLDIDMGENVTANASIVTLISSELLTEVDISESDIAKISINDTARITLDAFGDDVEFSGHVLSIEPAETEISGVVYYKTKIALDDTKEFSVRPGMTANITVITDTRPGVLVIPQRAINEKDHKKIVRVLKDKKTAAYDEREISTGIRGDDGLIEVTHGLNEGEEVITFIKE